MVDRLPQHPLMPVVFGPEHAPPEAPKLTWVVLPDENGERLHVTVKGPEPLVATEPVKITQHCFKPWCGIDGKVCIDCAPLQRTGL